MKKIATLEVYEVEESDSADEKEASSFYQRHDRKRDLHRIVLNPIHQCGACGTYDQVNVLAHELGHFVSHITDSPSAQGSMFEMILGVDTRVPEEKYAWEIAEKIAPIDHARKDAALKSYTG